MKLHRQFIELKQSDLPANILMQFVLSVQCVVILCAPARSTCTVVYCTLMARF